MNNKTILIDNNNTSLDKLTLYMQRQMPQLHLIGSFNTVNDSLALMQKEQPQLVFVNIEHLNAEKFLELQQIRNTACSIIFITPAFMEESLKHLPQQLVHSKKVAKKGIRLKIEDAHRFVQMDNIVRLQAHSNYTLFYLKDRIKPILTSKTLKSYSKQFNKNQFIRPHRSHLVNRNYIDCVIAKKEKFIVLNDGTQIKVSRRKVSELKLLVEFSARM